MPTDGTGTFAFLEWDEQPTSGAEQGAKLTYAKIANRFSGVIDGTSNLNYLMTYLADGAGVFVGYEQIDGKVGDRAGTFVLFHTGSVTNATSPTEFVVTATWSVVPGSGSGELTGLIGSGAFTGRHGVKETPYTFNYEIAE